MKRMLTLLALAAIAMIAVPAAQADGTFTIIEDLPGSFFAPVVYMSDDGQTLSGMGFDGTFYWNETEGVVWIDPDFATEARGGNCSGDGQVLAVTMPNPDGFNQAGYWNATDLFQFMGLVPDAAPCDASLSSAYELNFDGTIGTGLAWIGCDARAFKWTMGGDTVNLGSSGNSSRGSAISTDGMVIGGFDEHPSQGFRRPAIWSDDITGPQLIAGEDAAGEVLAVNSDGTMACGQLDFGAMYWDTASGAIPLGTLPGDEPYGALGLDISDNGEIVGFSGNPFFSTPRGLIWTPADGMMPLDEFFTANGVTGWEAYGIYSGTAISDDGQTIAGVYSDPDVFPPYGVYIVRLQGTVSIEGGDEATETPDLSLRLEGAYPNPFNPMTNVKFSMDYGQNVRLSVFDMSGRRIAVLADRHFAAGEHSVRWTGVNEMGQAVPSGTYLLRLDSAQGVRSDKMMLVR